MMSDVTKRLESFVKFYKRITDKKKPAEKKAKVEEREEEYKGPETEGASDGEEEKEKTE